MIKIEEKNDIAVTTYINFCYNRPKLDHIG